MAEKGIRQPKYYGVNQPPYFTIEELFEMIDEPNRSACKKIYEDHKELFETVQGSSYNHQAWPGGYKDHIQESMNVAVFVYEATHRRRPNPFSLSDLLTCVFFHDLEKLWKYEDGPDGEIRLRHGLQTKEEHQEFRMSKMKEYGVVLTAEQENGVKYAEGELKDYSRQRRVMNELAALAHASDNISARLWHNYPLEEDDPWFGAGRYRD